MNSRIVLSVAGAALVGGLAAFFLVKAAPGPQGTSGGVQGAPIASVTVPQTLSQAAKIGKNAFDAKCASCHGANAAGQEGVAPPLIHPYYRPNHHADEAFMRAARFGVRSHHWTFGDMPPVEGLTAADMKSIIRYVRELQKENGIF